MTTNNHQANGPVSLERLHQIRKILSKAAAQSDGGNLGYAMADAVKVIDVALSIPATLPCPVHLEPGLKFGKGVRTKCVLDALRRRADYYAELEAMTPEQRAEHDAGIAEFKAMLGTPAPVVPDEYRHLSELYHAQEKRLFKLAQRIKGPSFDKYAHSPSQAIDVLEAVIFGEDDDSCRAVMLQAGNSPVTPDGWIPVSEQMPNHKSELRVCVYTPTPHEDMRFRFVPASLFKAACSDATHWKYMHQPATLRQEE